MSLEKEEYLKVRHAMVKGARTIPDIEKMTDIIIGDNDHAQKIQEVLDNACRCKKVSYETVVNAVKNGAETLDDVRIATGAGTICARCCKLLERIIEDSKW